MSERIRSFPIVSKSFPVAKVLVLLAIAALANSCTKAAYYQTYVPSAADVSGIERVAVADFDGLEQTGNIVALKLTEGIVAAGHFRVYERAELDRILQERDFNQSGVVDPTTVSDLKLLGVDALIFGTVDAYNVDSQTGVERVNREVGTGRYREVQREGENGETETVKEEIKETITIQRPYILKSGTMAVTFRMANINTGEIVALRAETAHFKQREWSDESSRLPSKGMILDQLSRDVSNQFLSQIHPSWISQRVLFENNDAPSTKVGISYAQSGLWDKAYDEMANAVDQTPDDARTHYNLALVADVLGRYEDAEAAIERAIQIDPSRKYMAFLSSLRQRNGLSSAR